MSKDNKILAQMSTDIEEARQKANFSIESMLYLLRGGKEAVERLNSLREIAESEPVFSKAGAPFQSRQEVNDNLYIIHYKSFFSRKKKLIFCSNYITLCL